MDLYYCIPKNYAITFKPDFATFTYSGLETVTFAVSQDTSLLLFDCVGLEVKNCRLLNQKEIKTSFSTVDKFLNISFSNPLKKGTYKLEIEFMGKFSDTLAGWYKSRYEENKKTKFLVTTHFEPADARSAFPCIDHPSYKANFEIAMLIDKNLTSVSNMPVKKEKLQGEKKLVIFEKTPKMSTYLVYLGVGEFEWYEDKYKETIIRGITTAGKKQYAEFAVEWAKKCLKFYEEYFQKPYALPKLDLIAVPDFGSGAMENWGAITFRENLLLYYEKSSSLSTKQAIAEVVAHEIAHQWFGNLVTMKWWNDLWLNESFATFMEYKAVDNYFPQWNIWSNYITSMVFSGMGLDALHSSHPIQAEVKDCDQIDELFDEISYDKGGSILRMMESYAGEAEFREGLRKYIAKYQYKNTEGKDLWNAVEKTSQKQIDLLMQSFITKQGFPLIRVRQQENKLRIEQKQFFFSQKDSSNLWTIPLVITADSKVYKLLMTKKSAELSFNISSSFISANKDSAGFYVTEYDEKLLEKIGKNKNKLHYTSKLGVVHDQYFLTLANKNSLEKFLEFIEIYFLDENDPSTLNYIIGRLAKIHLLIPNEKNKQLLTGICEHALAMTGFIPKENENPHINYLRNSAFYALSLFDHKEVKDFSLKTFKKSLVDKTSLHPDLKSIIYALAVWSDDTNYEIVRRHYLTTTIQEEKAKYLSALGNSKNKKLLNETLEFCLTPEVRFAHILYLFSGISHNPHAKETAIDWLMENWSKLQKLSGGMHMIMRHMAKLIIPVCGLTKEKEATSFLDKQKIPGLERTLQQIKEELKINTAFIKNNS